MGLLDAPGLARPPADARAAARELETLVLKQVLLASGAFRGGETGQGQMWAEVLAEAVAGGVAAQQGLGLAALVEGALGGGGPEAAGAPGGPSRTSSGFGPRVDPIDGTSRFHAGVDLPAPEGSPIAAARDGVVVAAGPRGDYGNAVELSHGDGTTTLYAHAATVGVSPGQKVRAGEVIATVGSTGRSTGAHLHLELRTDGHPVDPRRLLQVYRARAEEGDGRNPPSGVTP